MKQMFCPVNGLRNIDEFACLGPASARPNDASASDDQWAAFLFHSNHLDDAILEYWRHTPSNTIFVAERDTRTDQILRTFDPALLPAEPAAGTSV